MPGSIQSNDLFLYARSFHKAARALVSSFQPVASPLAEFDASPVIFMYRHSLELHLKAIVLGEGANSPESEAGCDFNREVARCFLAGAIRCSDRDGTDVGKTVSMRRSREPGRFQSGG